MAIRRKFSFDLLRYDSSGDAEEDGEYINGNRNGNIGIPTRRGSDVAVKSHGRRRRNKALKKSATDLLLFSAEIDQIHENNVSENSRNFSSTCPDIKCFAEDTVERSESRFSEQAEDTVERSDSKFSEQAEDTVERSESRFSEQAEDTMERSESRFSEQAEVGNGGISRHAEDSVLLLLANGNNHNTRKDEPVALDNQTEHTHTDDSLIFRKATDMDGVLGTDQVDSVVPGDRVSVCLQGADGSVVVNTISNLDDFSNLCSNWGLSQHPSPPELRQRTVSASISVKANSCMKCIVENEIVEEEVLKGAANPSDGTQEAQQSDKDSNKGRVSFGDPPALLDWERVLAHSSEYPTQVRMSPFQYFVGEINEGNSLRSTTSVGNDKKRQRVYNTMFHVPWRCELLIDVGFFVCLDSFLSLLTIMPAKILAFIWRCLKIRQFLRPCADELSDLGCLVVLICGVALLHATDISLIYHFIRGQGTIKLYVVFNVLEIFDKLCQSFGGDVLQVLFNSAEGVASSSKESMAFEIARFILDQMIAVFAFIVHSSVILAQAITLSAAIISHNNALLALLVSNNFAEIKSNVFKRVSKENLHKLAYYDTVERFHIMAYILFVLAQNILEAENAWVWSFAMNACMIWCCEILVDVIKHAFLAKFNEIKPYAYSEFLEALCKQTLNSHSHEVHTTLTFIPIAPACVVIRVLTPIYAAHLPYGPFWWRWLWITLHFSVTYFMLATLKVIVGFGLQMHAKWYIYRCLTRKRHWHVD